MTRVLVIDDENNIRLMVRLALQAAGHEVETASDGLEGLMKFGDGSAWDVVLLDQRMPGMVGLEVLEEMRRLDADARIIIITAFGTIDLASDAMRAGATDFLRKPFTTETLRGAVEAALQASTPALPQDAISQSSPKKFEAAINGFRLTSQDDLPRVQNGAIAHTFSIRAPDGTQTSCEVLLPAFLVELVKARSGRENLAPTDRFWLWLCEESLANYLWQNSAPPETGVLAIDELTTSLSRWMETTLAA